VIIYFYVNSEIPSVKPKTSTSLLTPTPTPKKIGRFAYVYSNISDLSKLKLLYNADNEETPSIIQREKCRLAINGGFYDKESKPLGMLVAEGEQINPNFKSPLLNGYIWLTRQGAFGITDELPESEFKLALQSGPLLYLGGGESVLNTQNDKLSRRSLMAYLSTGEVLFMTIYDPESLFSGPKLNDLPSILTRIASNEDFTVVDAINLDGGSSSVYQDKQYQLGEYRPVKSLFCVSP